MAQYRGVAVISALVISLGITLWGLFQMPWSASVPVLSLDTVWDFLPGYVVVLLLSAVFVEAIARGLKVGRLIAGALLAGVVAILCGATWALLVTGWFALASFVVGGAILSALRIDSKHINSITRFLVGACAYGTAVGLLAHFPINYPGLYGVALIIPLVLAWRTLPRGVCASGTNLKQECGVKWLELAISAVALVHFSVALMPEVGHDALASHLFVPGHLARRQEWGFDITTYVWAVMPMMGDWIFSIGYMLAGETAARIINVGFIFVLGWLIRDMVLWAGGNAIGARWAVLLFLATPLTFTESSSLFIESVWASFVIAGSLSLFKFLQSDETEKAQIVLAGLLLGAALAAKAVTFTILPILLIFMVLRCRIWMRWSLIGSVVGGLVVCILVGAIPYATAWYLTGNPVFPFFNEIFKSPFWHMEAFEAPAIFGKGISWDVLYQVTFHTEKFLEARPGASGFQWLLLFFPALLALLLSGRKRALALSAAAVLFSILTFRSTAYLRYIFSSFALLAGCIGVALSTTSSYSVFVRRSLAIAGGAVVVLNMIFFESGTHYGDLSLQPLASYSGREAYLNNRLPIRNAVELINRLNVRRTPVAVFSSPLVAGMDADALFPTWYNSQFQTLVSEAGDSKAITQLLLGRGVEYVILDSNWGGVKKRKIIEDATTELAEFGPIVVRKVQGDYLFQTELLTNPNFSTYRGWTLITGSNDQPAEGIAVSVSTPAYQGVPVVARRRYKNSAMVFCADHPSQGRLQINWLDSKSQFISTDIQVFGCSSSEVSHTMEVTAPRNASIAIVYASGHTNVPVIFKTVSFMQ
jgi:hypothetical protein